LKFCLNPEKGRFEKMNKSYTIIGIGFIVIAALFFGLTRHAETIVKTNTDKVKNFHHIANVEVFDALREFSANTDTAGLIKFLADNGYADCSKPMSIIDLPSKSYCRNGENLIVKTFSPFASYTFRLSKNKAVVISVADEKNKPVEKADLPAKSFSTLKIDEKGQVESIIRNEMFRGKILSENLNSNFIRFALYNEDRNFFTHHGTDWFGLVRGTFRTVYNKVSKNGKSAQGASTITEQSAKLLFTDEEKTLTRRVWSMFLADAMEQKFSKAEILDFWLNSTVMGRENPSLNNEQGKTAMLREQLIGFQTAAQSLFSKNLLELSPNEQAILVCLPRDAKIDPNLKKDGTLNLKNENHLELDKKRKKALLEFAGFLKEKGEIVTSELYRQAGKEPVKFKFKEDDLTAEESLNFYLRDGLKNLRTKYAPKNDDEFLTLVTTVDRDFQRSLSTLTKVEMLRNKQNIKKIAGIKDNFELQADVVIMNAQDGKLKAFSSLKTSGNQVLPNRSNINNPSHIASPAKPFHLATAISEGKMSVDTLITPNECFAPDGFQFDSERKSDTVSMPVSQLLIYSNNNAFICVGNSVGIEKIEAKWRELFDLRNPTKEQYAKAGGNPYQLLRGLNRTEAELSPMQVAEGYTTLANNGVKTKINSIQTAFISSNQIEMPKPEQKQVFAPFAANAVTTILQTKARHEMKNLKPESILAIKTGSSPYSYWFVMYSPKTVIVGRFLIIGNQNVKLLEDVFAHDTIQPFMDNGVLKLIQDIRPNWLK
jgi:membrane peptidoglycan carboxypeptidase